MTATPADRPDDPADFYALLRTDPDAALKDVIARRELHRSLVHKALDGRTWFDCASCGVLDSQLDRARAANRP